MNLVNVRVRWLVLEPGFEPKHGCLVPTRHYTSGAPEISFLSFFLFPMTQQLASALLSDCGILWNIYIGESALHFQESCREPMLMEIRGNADEQSSSGLVSRVYL